MPICVDMVCGCFLYLGKVEQWQLYLLQSLKHVLSGSLQKFAYTC